MPIAKCSAEKRVALQPSRGWLRERQLHSSKSFPETRQIGVLSFDGRSHTQRSKCPLTLCRAQVHCDKNNRSTRLNARSFTRNISHRTIISAAHHHLQAIRMPTTAHIANGSAACISLSYVYCASHSSLSVTNPFVLSPRCIILLLGWRHPLRACSFQ